MENPISYVRHEQAAERKEIEVNRSIILRTLKQAYGEDWERSWRNSWFVHHYGTSSVEQEVKQEYVESLRTMARWWGVHGRVIAITLITVFASCIGFIDLKSLAAAIGSAGGVIVHEYVLFISRRFEDYAIRIEKKFTVETLAIRFNK